MTKDRSMTTITLRIPVDVVDSLKEFAPHKGFSGYQTEIGDQQVIGAPTGN